MRNFQYLAAAWFAIWVVFFLYQISLSRRFSRLLDEVKRLKETTSMTYHGVLASFPAIHSKQHPPAALSAMPVRQNLPLHRLLGLP